jgi:anaerobic selenocysteine-containing dehydrogenase
MILPLADLGNEITGWGSAGYGGFSNAVFFSSHNKKPEEAKTSDEIVCRLLEKLGGLPLAQRYFSDYKGGATWDADFEKSCADRYASAMVPWFKTKGVTAPSWDEVKKAAKGDGVTYWHGGDLTTFDDGDTYHGQGKEKGIDTQSGKCEIWNAALADPALRHQEHFDYKKRKYAHVPNDTKDLQPIAVYHPCYNGMEDYPKGRMKMYPLMLLTPKSRFRIHYLFGDPGCPTLIDAYRHSVHISPADAAARGIKENDMVRIWNQNGQSVMPAYVTNRMSPGVVIMRTGRRPVFTRSPELNTPDYTAMDIQGAANQFTGGDDVSPVTPAKVTSSVQIEKYSDGRAF